MTSYVLDDYNLNMLRVSVQRTKLETFSVGLGMKVVLPDQLTNLDSLFDFSLTNMNDTVDWITLSEMCLITFPLE